MNLCTFRVSAWCSESVVAAARALMALSYALQIRRYFHLENTDNSGSPQLDLEPVRWQLADSVSVP